MATLLKNLLLLLALASAIWLVVLWRWWATRYEASTADALRELVALPLLLFAFVLALRGALRGAAARLAREEAHAREAAAAATPAPAVGPEAPTVWPLLGAWVQTPAGAEVGTLREALATGQPRPVPDAELRDLDGLPVLCARIATLDVGAVEAALGTEASPAVLRALAALVPVLEQAGQRLQGWSDRFGLVRGQARRRIHVLAGWPVDWNEAERKAAQAWLARRLRNAAGDAVPASAWQGQAPQASGAELLDAAQRLLQTLRREDRDDLVLLLAAHSDLDDAALQRLEQSGRLFSMPARFRGVMPGEAAAALLLATRSWPPAEGDAPAQALVLQAVELAPRTPPLRRLARGPDPALLALLKQALQRAGLEPAAVGLVAGDAARHGEAASELQALVAALLPHLDPVEDVVLLGTACGHTGTAGALLALATAAGPCGEEGKAGLALGLEQEGWAVVAVVGSPESPTA
ncbi:hypothetical protein [Azohydromonas caseinilytica]|uniref:Uncharacterized protein n=1 Tax=Azohydromonas caseinilytica TaxID=2728836 RepID=A0A848FBT5_9BURK|nr:hypothetical protein [Azohydromonas caseinilytica]NML16376.1 hypothetical protein [Azohydromonas caseinilytica]